jgi:hypothetical protein
MALAILTPYSNPEVDCVLQANPLRSDGESLLEVIGAGYSRTGTLSLKHALEILGYGRCYHFVELLKRGHTARRLAILDGKPVNWDELLAGYSAAVDYPAAAYYRELAANYPEAKVILTVRDPDEWHASIREALLPLRRTLVSWVPWASKLGRLTDRLIWDGALEGRAAERDFAVARFHRHVREVRAEIDAQRLLVFDVKEGWEPLCRFLNRPVPPLPFPRTNSRRSLRAAVWLIRCGKLLAVVLLLALLVLLAVTIPWR